MRAFIERLSHLGLHLFPRALWLALALGAVLSLPSFKFDRFADDYLHLAILEGHPSPGTPFDLFAFARSDPTEIRRLIETGNYPWWTLPELKVAFWRPLSSALMVLDHTLFGRNLIPYHLHSILWYLLVIAAAGGLLRQLPGAMGGLALLIFAADETHVFPVMWMANRNALVSCAPALFGLWMHLRWREQGWRPGLPLSLLGLGVGLLGGETALGGLAYLGAYELFGNSKPVANRARALLPALVLGLGYLIVYRTLGYGAHGSGVYMDPVGEWQHYLPALVTRIPTLLAGQFWVLPPELWLFVPSARPTQVLVGSLTVVVVGLLLLAVRRVLSEDEWRHTRWLVAGGLLSLLPVAATFPSGRLLLLPSLGGSALLAVFAIGVWRILAQPAPSGWKKGLLGTVTGLMLGLQVLATGFWLLYPFVMRAMDDAILQAIARMELDEARLPQQDVVTLVVPDPIVGLYPATIRALQGRPPARSWLPLSMAPYDHVLRRTGDKTFELYLPEGRFLSTDLEQMVRGPAYRLREGEQVASKGCRVTVLEVEEGYPKRIRFEFERSLDDPDLVLLTQGDRTLRRMHAPPVGESMTLSWASVMGQ